MIRSMAGNEAAVFGLAGKRVWVAGHKGLVGSAILRRLASEECEILTASRSELDLSRQQAVEAWFDRHRPEAVFVAAARVGGIHANSALPADFIYDNLVIAANIIHAAYQFGVQKLLYLGSSCAYPRLAPQPMAESALLTGPFEPTNEWYATAKVAGIKLCQAFRRQHACDFIAVIPTNLYGPGDNFDPETSHVPAALLRRLHEAKLARVRTATVWGSGRPRREFLHVDDLADACVFLMRIYSRPEPVNIGTGEDISIAEFAALIRQVVKFDGDLVFDAARPDGAPRKLLDVGKLRALGWSARTPLPEGLARYYDWYLAHVAGAKGAAGGCGG